MTTGRRKSIESLLATLATTLEDFRLNPAEHAKKRFGFIRNGA